jgi:hypothetical protein
LKKTALAVAVSVLAVLIVLPVVGSVNLSAGKSITIDRTQFADGSPLPPPIPPSSMNADTFVADGSPLPPPIPPSSMSADTFVADGSPLPPPIPPKTPQSRLVA